MTGTAPVCQSQKTLESYTSLVQMSSLQGNVLSLLVKNGFQSSCRASVPYIPENTHTHILIEYRKRKSIPTKGKKRNRMKQTRLLTEMRL